jgi:hypothetical protein
MTEQQVATARAAGSFAKQFGDIGQAADIAKDYAINESINFNRILESVGGDYKKAMALAAQQAKTQQGGNAAALLEAQRNINNFGTSIMGLVALVLEPLGKRLAAWGVTMTGWGESAVEKFKGPVESFAKFMDNIILPQLEKIGIWFGNWFTKLSKSKNGTGFWEIIGDALKDGLSNIWEVLEPIWENTIKPGMKTVFDSVVEFLKPYMKKAFDYIFDQVNAYVYKESGGRIGDDPRWRELSRTSQYRQEDLAVMKEQARKLQDQGKTDEAAKILRDVDEKTKKLADWFNVAKEALDRNKNAELPPFPKNYAFGTLGMSGKLFEDFGAGTPANLHGQEAVVTPDQMSNIVNSAQNNNLVVGIQRLNTLTAEILTAMRDTNDISRKTLNATKSLTGNLFT